jgi:hypothetical protein
MRVGLIAADYMQTSSRMNFLEAGRIAMTCKSLFRSFGRWAAAALVFAWSHSALAWDGVNTGVPGLIEITHGQNYGFRVHLTNVTAMCGSGSFNWVYLNASDSNYTTYVAAILAAKAQGTEVLLYGVLEPGGYCKLGHMAMR